MYYISLKTYIMRDNIQWKGKRWRKKGKLKTLIWKAYILREKEERRKSLRSLKFDLLTIEDHTPLNKKNKNLE